MCLPKALGSLTDGYNINDEQHLYNFALPLTIPTISGEHPDPPWGPCHMLQHVDRLWKCAVSMGCGLVQLLQVTIGHCQQGRG